METIKRQTTVWLQAKVRDCGLGLRSRLYVGHVCGAAIVVLYRRNFYLYNILQELAPRKTVPATRAVRVRVQYERFRHLIGDERHQSGGRRTSGQSDGLVGEVVAKEEGTSTRRCLLVDGRRVHGDRRRLAVDARMCSTVARSRHPEVVSINPSAQHNEFRCTSRNTFSPYYRGWNYNGA